MAAYSIRFLTLVRHGQYYENRAEQGELTDKGIAQIKLAAQALQLQQVDTIHNSTVKRAVQSSEIIGQVFPKIRRHSSDLLRECIPSLPAHIIARHGASAYNTQEAMTRCLERFHQAWDEFAQPLSIPNEETHEVLVCHGNIIRYFVARSLGVSPDVWINMLIHHAGITRIRVDFDGSPTLISHNDIGHLPPKLRTI